MNTHEECLCSSQLKIECLAPWLSHIHKAGNHVILRTHSLSVHSLAQHSLLLLHTQSAITLYSGAKPSRSTGNVAKQSDMGTHALIYRFTDQDNYVNQA